MSEEPKHTIAKFKAKYALNESDMPNILDRAPLLVHEWIRSGDCPDEVENFLARVDFVVGRIDRETKLLGDNASYNQIAKHDLEVAKRAAKENKDEMEKDMESLRRKHLTVLYKLDQLRNSFLTRLKVLFRPDLIAPES